MIGLIARKEGMSRVFTDEGKSIPVTVLKIHSNVVSQIKTSEKDGYDAIQISAVEQSEKNQSKACLLYTSPSPRDPKTSRMPSSA